MRTILGVCCRRKAFLFGAQRRSFGRRDSGKAVWPRGFGICILECFSVTVLDSTTAIVPGAAPPRRHAQPSTIVLSYTNVGKVTERGVELGVGYQFTSEVRVDVSFTGFDFEVKSQRAGDQLLPNTPSVPSS